MFSCNTCIASKDGLSSCGSMELSMICIFPSAISSSSPTLLKKGEVVLVPYIASQIKWNLKLKILQVSNISIRLTFWSFHSIMDKLQITKSNILTIMLEASVVYD